MYMRDRLIEDKELIDKKIFKKVYINDKELNKIVKSLK